MSTPEEQALILRWARLWRQVGTASTSTSVYEELHAQYSQPHRHYHNLQHVRDCLAEFDSARQLAHDPLTVELAIWFHDAVYDTHATDNEEQSADLAKRRIREAGGSVDLSGSVAALVLATKTHAPVDHPDARLVLDVDLSILGQPERRFQQFESQIRQEYAWVPAETFAHKRAEILAAFLARERIYGTEKFYAKYEQMARANLQSAIRKLIRSLEVDS